MKIPILNFLLSSKYKNNLIKKNKYLLNFNNLNFHKVKNDIFPIYKFFNKIDKEIPQNLIKFNVGNEFAVNLFKNNKINYTDIYKIIKKVTSLNLYSSVNNINDIINYHEEIEQNLSKTKLYSN